MLSVEQISKRLDDRFRLLTGGARTALPRQQTLRALIDWSYDILSDNERLLLQRLSVFAGGWTLDAAEEVCVVQDGILHYDVLDLLTQLVNKSLVVVMEQSQGRETRYRMLETIRQYTREKLLEAGGSEIIRQQHLAYFVKLVEQAEPELYHSNQLRWLKRLDDELDNLRMALEWALATDVEAGLRITSIPWRFWDVRGYFQENGNWLKQLLEQYKTTDTLSAWALAVYSLFNFRQGNFSEAVKIAEESVQMARVLSDKKSEAFSLSFLGVFNQYQGNFEAGELLLEESLNLYRALGDRIGQANTLESLSTFGRDLEQAITYAKESFGIYRELGSPSGIANSLRTLVHLTIMSGDISSPIPWLREALSISHQLGDHLGEALDYVNYGRLAYWRGEYQQAIAYYDEATRLNEETGSLGIYPWIQVHKVYAVLRQGDVRQAREMFEESIWRTQKMNVMIFLVFALEGLSSLHVSQNQPERAAQLFAWADAMREKLGDRRPPIEQASVEKDLAVIHSKVDDTEFARLTSEGRTMTLEQAIALALEE
jgi:non-specific serine/threonine protein kinase